jgi:hypothetical protein
MSRATRAAALVIAAALLGGCGIAQGAARKAQGADGGPSTVEKLAAATGCAKPSITVDAKDLRTGICKMSADQGWSVTTFATDQGQKEWLEDALDYGGVYLVGTRWIVLGNTKELVEPFRAKLGGTIKVGGHMMPSNQPMPDGHSMTPGQPMQNMDMGDMPAGHSM